MGFIKGMHGVNRGNAWGSSGECRGFIRGMHGVHQRNYDPSNGKWYHSLCKAYLSWGKLVGALGRLLSLLSSSSHKCSIGNRSGLNAGQLCGFTLLLAITCWQTRTTWGRALSCWKIRLCACTHGTAAGRRISSLYMFIILGQAIKYLSHILCNRSFLFVLVYIMIQQDWLFRKKKKLRKSYFALSNPAEACYEVIKSTKKSTPLAIHFYLTLARIIGIKSVAYYVVRCRL